MKYNEQNQLCLHYSDYVAVFGVPGFKNDRHRRNLVLLSRGGNGNEALIDYESLSDDRKARIIKKYGEPSEYILKQPLIEWVALNRNEKAFKFYSKYPLQNNTVLPANYRDKYTQAVTYIDAINYYTTDKLALKRDFNINMTAFWEIVCDVIRAENVGLPANPKRLKEKIVKYKCGGFELLIEAWRFGNENTKKVKDKAEDVLMKLLELDNKHADEVVAASYNLWAVEKGNKTISPAAVAYRRRNHDYELVMAREGKSAAYNKYNPVNKQRRASSPLMLINSDDNVLDLFFTEVTYVNGRKVTNHYNRPVAYVVMDTFNDYILGYAVGETVTKELVKQAYRNAMAHIVELTGAPFLWHQIKTDKWAIDPALEGELPTFFKMGGDTIFFPGSSKQSKYIERVFGRPLHRVLKVFPNYSGANITAKSVTSRPNPDALQARSKNFPDIKYSPDVIEMAVNTLRHSVAEGETESRQQKWLRVFNESDFCKNRAITTERKLELLGVKHEVNEPIRLRNTHINFQINKVKHCFEIPGRFFPEHNNKRVEVIYDPADMSQVLVTDGKGIRFVADSYVLNHSAIADMRDGDGQLHADRQLASKDITRKLETYVADRDERLRREQINAESLIMAGVLTKAINHKAQKVVGGYNDEGECNSPGQGVVVAKEWSIYDDM
jgi:hypothetical protein